MRFSHRLAPTRDQSQSGSVIRSKQSRAHQPQLTCMLTKGLSVDPAVFLFGWLAWRRPSPSAFFSCRMLWRKVRGLALCRQDCSKRRMSRFRLITTAFRSRYLDRLMRITATSQISTTCPSKPNIGRRSWVMSRGPKGPLGAARTRHRAYSTWLQIVAKRTSRATTRPFKIRSRNWLKNPKRKSFVVTIRKPTSESFGLIPKREHLSTRLQS